MVHETKKLRVERDRHSRVILAVQKQAAITFLVAGAIVILMIIYSLKGAASRPESEKRSSASARIAFLGAFISLSLGASSLFMAARQTKNRIESVEKLLKAGMSDEKAASKVGLSLQTVQFVRSKMKD
jgi:hypothetical protein